MDRSRWTVKDYQRALASRGAKVSGRKKELIDRLEAYERNDNFGAQPIISEAQDPLPNFPSISEFRYARATSEIVLVFRVCLCSWTWFPFGLLPWLILNPKARNRFKQYNMFRTDVTVNTYYKSNLSFRTFCIMFLKCVDRSKYSAFLGRSPITAVIWFPRWFGPMLSSMSFIARTWDRRTISPKPSCMASR